jgi:hypothetical protein
MKLPDFYQHAGLNNLRQQMNNAPIAWKAEDYAAREAQREYCCTHPVRVFSARKEKLDFARKTLGEIIHELRPIQRVKLWRAYRWVRKGGSKPSSSVLQCKFGPLRTYIFR